MLYKAVFHINLDDDTPMNQGLNNVTNLLLAIPDHDHDLIVLINGPAVRLVAEDGCDPYIERIKNLKGQGVRFQACRNALNKFDVDPDKLVDECEIIPAGIVALIELQNDGYAYIKP